MSGPLEIADFSGGVTDYYLTAPPNKLRRCDNLFLVPFPGGGKPYTRPGSEIAFDQIPAGSQRVGTIVKLDDVLHVQSSAALYAAYTYGGAWSTISSRAGGNSFYATTADYFTVAPWNHHILWASSAVKYPIKSWVDASGFVQSKSARAPRFTTSVTFGTSPGAGNYLYKFVYRNTYTTKDSIVYSDVGTPSSIRSVTNKDITAGISFTWASYVNGSDDKFDLGGLSGNGMFVDIYRTTHNGTVFYYVMTVPDSDGPFGSATDFTSDGTLTTHALLYTEGGGQPNDRPPPCALVHILGDTGYYGYCKDSTGVLQRQRLMQSIPGDFDAVPSTFYVDLDDEMAGLSSTRSNIITLCRNGNVYRIEGQIDALGRGELIPVRISDASTCVSSRSVVQAHDGLFWAGYEGIWYTDGYQVVRLNQDYDKTWKTFVSVAGVSDRTKQDKIVGTFDKRNNRIWWTVQASDAASEPDTCYVLDLNYGVKANATFTTATGGSAFAPTYIHFDGDYLYRSSATGYVLTHKPTLYTDVQPAAGAISTWPKQTIVYDLETTAFNFGTSSLRKYVTNLSLVADAFTNASIQVVSNNDDGRQETSLLPIRHYGSMVWGDADIYWGDPSWAWNAQGLLIAKRRMPAKNLRCTHKSVRFTNAYVTIVTSDLLGTADVDGPGKTATLTTAGKAWPTNVKDWYISFESDGYTNDYLITTNNYTGTAVTVAFVDDYGNAATASGSKWEIKGYPKGEVFNLTSFAMNYDVFSPTQNAYKAAEQGDVSA